MERCRDYKRPRRNQTCRVRAARSLGNEGGCPTRRLYAWGLFHGVATNPVGGQNLSATRSKAPHANAACGAPKIISNVESGLAAQVALDLQKPPARRRRHQNSPAMIFLLGTRAAIYFDGNIIGRGRSSAMR